MDQLPKITVITPSYNQGRYLEQTILSVQEQDYPNLEYIVIDGGSTDESVSILNKYSSKINYWVSEKDKGTYDAVNKALKKFTGDYWVVVNSDDTLAPGALKDIAATLQQQNYPDWITAGIRFIDENAEEIGQSIPVYPEKVGGMYFLQECWIYHPVTFLSSKLFREVGYFNKLDILDYDYWLRAEKAGYLPVIIPKVLGNLRYHVDCKSMDFLKIYQSKIELLSSYREEMQEENSAASLQKHIAGQRLSYFQTKVKLLVYNKRYASALGLLFSTLLKYPLQFFKRWPYGLLRRFVSGMNESEFSPRYFLRNMN
jgi:glycosyltransferase involved in cell wall biosynthesis